MIIDIGFVVIVGHDWQTFSVSGHIVIKVMHNLTIVLRSEKCVRLFHPCANVVECTYTNLGGVAYYTLRLSGMAYCA